MDEDPKTLLKKAKEAITQKQFRDAQDLCRAALRKDPKNYMAHVLLGAALQDSDAASTAFESAISLSRDKLLAWQGLCTFLEKRRDGASKERLVDVYITMITIDKTRFGEYAEKLFEVSLILNDVKTLRFFYETYKKSDNIASLDYAKKLLRNGPSFQSEDRDFVSELFRITDDDEVATLKLIKHYFDAFGFESALEKALNLPILERSGCILDFVCRISAEYYIRNGETPRAELLSISKRVLETTPSSYDAALLTALFLYLNAEYVEAYSLLCPFIDSVSNRVYGAVVLIDCCVRLSKYSEASSLLKILNAAAQSERASLAARLSVNRIIIAAQHNSEEAVSIAEKLNVNDVDCIAALVKAYVEIGSRERASELLETIAASNFYIPLKAMLLRVDNRAEDAKQLLETAPSDSFAFHMESGATYWSLKQYEKSVEALKKAAYLNPYVYQPFFYLGLYYNDVEKNVIKAKKCFLKAFQLKPNDAETMLQLSALHHAANDDESHLALLRTAVDRIGNRFAWPHHRIGLLHIKRHQWTDAILSFHNVIKFDERNVTAWECLSDAYFLRGSYHSSLKCCGKIETITHSDYAVAQTGLILLALGRYREALRSLRDVNPSYSPVRVNKGLAECYVALSTEYLKNHLYYCAAEAAQNAIQICCVSEMRFASQHRVLGDAITIVTQLPKRYASYTYGDRIVDNLNEMFDAVVSCYTKAIAVAPLMAKSPFYYKLSVTHYAHFKTTLDEEYLRKALSFASHCVRSETNNVYWNLYGVLLMRLKRYDLAQHSFTRSLRCRESPAAWTNLGMLYIELNYAMLANACFANAQQLDPSYARSWTGQALLAERIRPYEAADLFRQACILGYHDESALSFASWLNRIINDGTASKLTRAAAVRSIPSGIDLIAFHHEYESSAFSLTELGLLQENMKLFRPCLNSFKNACEMESNDVTNLNYARALFRNENYTEAIEHLKKIGKSTLQSGCVAALALYKLNEYERSYETYETILEWLASSDSDKANVLIAIALIIYRLQGVADAKPLLQQAISLTKTDSCVKVIGTLAIVEDDRDLIDLINLNTASKYTSEAIAFLTFLIKKSIENPEKHLLTSLHTLKSHINNFDIPKAKVLIKKTQNNLITSPLLELIEAYYEAPYKCLKISQKIIRKRPDLVENYTYLVFSMVLCKFSTERIEAVVKYAIETLQPTLNVKTWLLKAGLVIV